ncbi:nucleotidyl transferase AbiEii/AbiGii toxin family protein [Embleya sp. NPDC050154]|uniref:nucleotidyl transferase AbiEii/AbiGii toxin family protein n=1 Tax=Embleya sp. NPDC050154 TaxID=3363988 RepID=UPI0037B3A033
MRANRKSVARRAVLDHLLSLIADAPWSESLVLRGSMVMPAWVGDRAREPADLDFVVMTAPPARVDALDPYPFVARTEVVQQWPEAANGAARYEIWTDGEEEFEMRGLRPRVPPDGLRWDPDPDPPELVPDYHDLVDRVRSRPMAAPGIALDASGVHRDSTWSYAYDGSESGGIRVLVPWRAAGLGSGAAQLDFAFDETLHRPPVWTLVPRADGAAPTLMRTASRELSLAWKLLWLYADGADGAGSRGKDLHDAVLLAEDTRTALSVPLLRQVLRTHTLRTATASSAFGSRAVKVAETDWAAFRAEHPRVRGSARDWLRRLDVALAGVFARLEGTTVRESAEVG